ncbi:MAG TPA: hypothetical protein VFE62_01380 [Gemmataceae bacterium]|nr:hypothetical protein [Gemmataceae bacterium]
MTRMSPSTFYATCLSLWGEDWRPELRKRLAEYPDVGKSRQTFLNWRYGKVPVPVKVAELLRAEKRRRKEAR